MHVFQCFDAKSISGYCDLLPLAVCFFTSSYKFLKNNVNDKIMVFEGIINGAFSSLVLNQTDQKHSNKDIILHNTLNTDFVTTAVRIYPLR